MKKDKEWLEKQINKTLNIDGGSGERIKGFNKGLEFSLDLIEELDEPEKVVVSKMEKVVIPQFVAETIEKYKKNDDSLGELLASVEHANIKYYHGMEKNRVAFNTCYEPSVDFCETIAKAWLDGYTIEKEKLYYLKLKEDLAEQMLLTRHKYLNVSIGKSGQAYTFDDKIGYSSYFKTKLTKEEVGIWKNKLNELEFDIVEVTE